MTSLNTITREMDCLEEHARRIVADRTMTSTERRLALERLLRRYHALEDYRAALVAFIRRMREQQDGQPPDPEGVIRDVLSAPEFAQLQLMVLVLFAAAVYSDGPRAEWVPMALLPTLALDLLNPQPPNGTGCHW